MIPILTTHEVAHIARVTLDDIEHEIQAGLFQAACQPMGPGRAPARLLPISTVSYMTLMQRLPLLKSLEHTEKRALYARIRKMKRGEMQVIDLYPGLILDVPLIAGVEFEIASQYARNKSAHLLVDDANPDGDPIIRGTDISVSDIRARLEAGAAMSDLRAAFPHVPHLALSAAEIYARSHEPAPLALSLTPAEELPPAAVAPTAILEI